MKFIKPTTITEAMLISSNVPETPPSAYAGGTTYSLGQQVSTGTAGGVITVYESLQNSNTGHTPASSPTWWAEIGTTYAAWNSGTTYTAGQTVLSATTHRIYEAVQGANTNHDPTTDTTSTWWLDIGPTNRWAMLDAVVGTVAARLDPLTVVIDAGIIDSLALLDVAGSDVDISMLDAPGGTSVYSQNYPLGDTAIVLDWYQYFFSDIVPRTTLIVSDLPPYSTGRLTVTINAVSTAECGTLVVGRMVSLGDTLRAPGVGIIDYSRKETDQFGQTSVVQRSYAKKIEARWILETSKVDYAARQLAAVRATPVIWIADDKDIIESLIAYGFYRDWGIDVTWADYSEATMNIEGLT